MLIVNRNNPENAYLLEEMIVLRDQQAAAPL